MADIKFLNMSAPNAGSKDVFLGDVFEGLSFSRSHYRPTNPVRTQNGTLITQSTYANKKNLSLSGGVFVSTLPDYLKVIYEANETVTVIIYDYVEGVISTESTYSMKIISFEDSKDFVNSIRNWSVELQQI